MEVAKDEEAGADLLRGLRNRFTGARSGVVRRKFYVKCVRYES